jgi:hypothetical protein
MNRDPDDIHAALAALADGTLPEQRRESVLARVADSPELAAELEEQRRAVTLVRSLEGVQAPHLLRRSIELAAAGEVAASAAPDAAGAAGVAGSRSSRFAAGSAAAEGEAAARRRRLRDPRSVGRSPRRPSRIFIGGLLAAGAAVVVVLALVLSSGGGGAAAPTVSRASGAGLLAATSSPPGENPRNPHLLSASAAGIPYPYWGGSLGWSAVGRRTDTIGDRAVTTVFYANHHGRRIGYSIVAGDALPIPAGAVAVVWHGVSFHVVSPANPTIVAWRESGHTCILTSREVAVRTLVRLAAWARA